MDWSPQRKQAAASYSHASAADSDRVLQKERDATASDLPVFALFSATSAESFSEKREYGAKL
jgi:hypothetical protein